MFNQILRYTKRSLNRSAEGALNSAYESASKIKKIENEHFEGKKIIFDNGNYSERVFDYFQSELASNLKNIDVKLNQFKTSRYFQNFFNQNRSDVAEYEQSIILEKLNFIDNISNKYSQPSEIQLKKVTNISPANQKSGVKISREEAEKLETVSDKTSILPRSFLRTLNKIKREIDPESKETEEQILSSFRKSKYKTAVSVKFLLLLIIIPILVHNVSKITLGKIFVDPYFSHHEQVLFINQDLQKEALEELRIFEENLALKSLLGLTEKLSQEEKELKIQEKAQELAQSYRRQSANAIKNIFSDVFAFISFALILVYSKREVQILKSFIDELIYGLSDSAKAFLIILFTDIFVGFHSPHGWEIILEGVARHFGLPENRDFNFLFIATFPVILDTVLKYWIFRYLNRISPSAVATYKNMNES